MKKGLTIQATGATKVEGDRTSVEVEAFRTLSGEPEATWTVVFYDTDGVEQADVVGVGRKPRRDELKRIVEAATEELRREG